MKTEYDALSWLKSLLQKQSPPEKSDIELTYAAGKKRSVVWAQGKSGQEEVANSEGVCVRVIKEGRQAISTVASINDADVFTALALATENASFSEMDPHRKLGRPASSYPLAQKTDSTLFQESIESIQDSFRTLESKILKTDPRLKKIVKFSLSESTSLSSVVNSNGLAVAAPSSSATFLVEILAEDKGETEVAWDFQSQWFRRDLRIEDVAMSIAQQALESLGGRSLPSGEMAVVFAPRVGTQLLGMMASALSAESVQMGRSFYAGKKGQRVSSELVNVVDDPLLAGGVASAPFDDEGTPHKRISMLKNGILRDFFYDLRTASKEGCSSTGHGIKAGLSSAPSPSATNFYMEAGATDLKDLHSSHSKIFLIRDVMGLHMSDPISGEFSLGASGLLLENGQVKQSVRGVTVAGDIATLFKNIALVGNDLTWYGAIGAPSFLVPSITIAGN